MDALFLVDSIVVVVRGETGKDPRHDWWSMSLSGTAFTRCEWGVALTRRLLHADIRTHLELLEDGEIRESADAVTSHLLRMHQVGRLSAVLRSAEIEYPTINEETAGARVGAFAGEQSTFARPSPQSPG